MNSFRSLTCQVFGHAGPSGVPYKEAEPVPRVSGNATLSRVDWTCPRCGREAWALSMRADRVQRAPGAERIEHEAN